MTIRPLRVDVSNIHRYRIQTHRGEKIANDIKIPDNFWIKLYSYPVTAFGYTDGITLDEKDKINPKFDRNDVIKALDFWIEYWVYENKKDYILQGTVNKDFELMVRELIEFRQEVLKCPVDTQFVRQKIRPGIGSDFDREFRLDHINEVDKILWTEKTIEFTENVIQDGNSISSTVEQFCYKVRTMTYREYLNYKNGILTITNPNTAAVNRALVDLAENFRDSSTRFILSGSELIDRTFTFPLITETTNPPFHNVSSTDSDIMTYENMAFRFGDMGATSGGNSFVMVPIILQGLGADRIYMDVYVESGRLIDNIGMFGINHTVRIRQNEHSLEIDGQLYYATNIHIEHDPRHRSIMFDNLWIESVNITASETFMTINFQQTGDNVFRTNLEITFTQPIRGEFMRQNFNSNQQLYPFSLRMLGNNRVWIGHTGTNEGDIYDISEPLKINMD